MVTGVMEILFVEFYYYTFFLFQDGDGCHPPGRCCCSSLSPPPGPALLPSSTLDLSLGFHREGPLWGWGNCGYVTSLLFFSICIYNYATSKKLLHTCIKYVS